VKHLSTNGIRAMLLAALLALTALGGIGVTGVAAKGSQSGTSSVFTIGPGHTFIANIPGASSTLIRRPNGINVTLQTTGLPAGHAVTVWALIFNNPSACPAGGCHEMNGDLNIPEVQGSVYHVTGHIVGSTGSFAGSVPVGDATNAFRGPGLLNPFGAEIHLIVRDHGVAATGGLLQQQFNDTSPRFCNPDDACSDIQESIHLSSQ
jgi:hypothetical protein